MKATNVSKLIESDLVSQYVFFPNGNIDFDIYWIEVNGVKLSCYYHQEGENNKTILVFHGNGESISDYINSYLNLFEKLHLNVLLVEYRGYSASTGKSSIINIVDDANEIFKELKLDRTKTIVYGRSIGAIPALNLAITQSLAGIIIENGVIDVKKWLLTKIDNYKIQINTEKVKDEIAAHFVTKKAITAYKGNVLIFHSFHDELVPRQHSEMLNNLFTCEKKIAPCHVSGHNTYLYYNFDNMLLEMRGLMSKIEKDNSD